MSFLRPVYVRVCLCVLPISSSSAVMLLERRVRLVLGSLLGGGGAERPLSIKRHSVTPQSRNVMVLWSNDCMYDVLSCIYTHPFCEQHLRCQASASLTPLS